MATAKIPTPVVIDFETLGIEGRPDYPPPPVGVSIKYPGKKARYWGFGHAVGNNCTWPEAREALAKAYEWGQKKGHGLLFHNAKFDLDVAETHLDLSVPAWEYIHDTMLLLFLDDPHQKELSLKPSAERLLDMPPEERDAVRDWLLENQPVPGVKITTGKGGTHYFGRYIALVPGDIVGRYADGDVNRTDALFSLLWRRLQDKDMIRAYDRERRLLPRLLNMERRGVPVDLKRLRADVESYSVWLDKLNLWIIKTIKAPVDINLNSADQLVEAMVASGKADPNLLPRTKTGKFGTSQEALEQGVTDPQLLAALRYRAQLNTCMNTFMWPWLEVAERSVATGPARIFTTWNQTKSAEGNSSIGTRTGRLSSTPNFQNIPKEFAAIWRHEDPKNKNLPKCPWPDLPPLPLVRGYIVPFPGHVFVDRDYSQQEPRILAHFDGGELMEKYLENPWIDFHDSARDELAKMGKIYDRKPVKNTNLGLIYGMGVGKLAIKNGMTVNESQELKNAILKLYPGLKAMYKDMRFRARENQPIRTWGGRVYYCEPPKLVDGRWREFDYKLVNVLVQGSAADCTKEAIIRWCEAVEERGKQDTWFLLLNVHDQLTASVPQAELAEAMEVLRETMESVEFDVPILSEGSVSFTTWADLVEYDKKGVKTWQPPKRKAA